MKSMGGEVDPRFRSSHISLESHMKSRFHCPPTQPHSLRLHGQRAAQLGPRRGGRSMQKLFFLPSPSIPSTSLAIFLDGRKAVCPKLTDDFRPLRTPGQSVNVLSWYKVVRTLRTQARGNLPKYCPLCPSCPFHWTMKCHIQIYKDASASRDPGG